MIFWQYSERQTQVPLKWCSYLPEEWQGGSGDIFYPELFIPRPIWHFPSGWLNEKNWGNTPSPVLRKEEDYGLRLLPLSLRCSVGVSCKVACMLMNPFGVCVLCRVRKQSCKWSEGYIPTGLWNSSWATIWPVQGMIITGRHRRHLLFSKFRFPYRHCHVMPWREVSPRQEFSQ